MSNPVHVSPGRRCEVCGGPLGANNTVGVCRLTDKCTSIRSQRRYRRARGIKPAWGSLHIRLYSKLIADPSGCLLWTGRCERGGYGLIKAYGRERPVHVAMWMLHEDAIPMGMELDHLCHNRDVSCAGGTTCTHRRCANLSHLEVVTKLTNIQRIHARRAPQAPRLRTHSSQYTGVTWHRKLGKWQAAIGIAGKNHYLGVFTSEEDAARAYNVAALAALRPADYLNEVAP